MVDRRLLEALLDELPVGLVLLDTDGRVLFFNRYEQRMARRGPERVVGRDFFRDVAPCMDVKALAGQYRDRIGRAPLEAEVPVQIGLPHLEQPRDVMIRLRSFELDRAPYGLVILEDVSAARAVERLRETLGGLLVHDMKNPLAVVDGHLELLARSPVIAADETARTHVAAARVADRRLGRMLLDLLDVTRLENRDVVLQRQSTDLAMVVGEAVEASRVIAARRGLGVALDVVPTEAEVDPSLLRRALDNLLDNAVRYAVGGRDVVARVRPRGDEAVVEIVDDGPGVPEALRERVFDKYFQAIAPGEGHARTRGLGLTLVQLVMRAHGGKVEIDDAPGGGAVFRLRVPRRLHIASSHTAPSPTQLPGR